MFILAVIFSLVLWECMRWKNVVLSNKLWFLNNPRSMNGIVEWGFGWHLWRVILFSLNCIESDMKPISTYENGNRSITFRCKHWYNMCIISYSHSERVSQNQYIIWALPPHRRRWKALMGRWHRTIPMFLGVYIIQGIVYSINSSNTMTAKYSVTLYISRNMDISWQHDKKEPKLFQTENNSKST